MSDSASSSSVKKRGRPQKKDVSNNLLNKIALLKANIKSNVRVLRSGTVTYNNTMGPPHADMSTDINSNIDENIKNVTGDNQPIPAIKQYIAPIVIEGIIQ